VRQRLFEKRQQDVIRALGLVPLFPACSKISFLSTMKTSRQKRR
jgi:hypothetical protein